ncbi:MAG: hypothetical protein B7Z08_10110 [Sphingomonadales bacterium 32-68-7]|nr:MAG: hypothetical protein B7Z33_11455 [Sphingomonadales bacterium 12-68-11]OYX08281.1 MAG: hypothetical protein B7Z08_10110 [Sphingomonadales bacterium 32-68-7]
MADPEPAGERIAKLLARAGIASRREVERMIADGRVAVGGQVLTTPATILPSLRGVTVDGKPVAAPERARLFRFHKPAGLITAERDPAGRPTIYDALRNALPPGTPRLMPIGRLDFSTEGLLLMTNDGELKRTMELPASGVPRTYRARTFGAITQARLEDLFDGIEVEGVRYGRIEANMERRTGRNQWIELTLTEGKNREVRRVLEHLGLQVSRLIRTAYGPFALGDLARGAALEVRVDELERFAGGLKGFTLKVSPGAPQGIGSAGANPSPKPSAARGKRAPKPPRRRADGEIAKLPRAEGAPAKAPRRRPRSGPAQAAVASSPGGKPSSGKPAGSRKPGKPRAGVSSAPPRGTPKRGPKK